MEENTNKLINVSLILNLSSCRSCFVLSWEYVSNFSSQGRKAELQTQLSLDAEEIRIKPGKPEIEKCSSDFCIKSIYWLACKFMHAVQ